MISIVQRVTSATVTTNDQSVSIGPGYLVLLGIHQADTPQDARKLATKITALRLMGDDQGKINLSLAQAGGQLLIVSQFSLYADLKGNNRPSFVKAADSQIALPLYQQFVDYCRSTGLPVTTGFFGQLMQINLTNDGPLTVIADSAKL